MPSVDNLYFISAGVELFAASIMAILLLGCWEERQYRTKTNRLFVAVLAIQTLLLIGDSAIWLLLNEPAPGEIPLVKTLTLITDIMTVVLTVVYTYFLTNFISQKSLFLLRFPTLYRLFAVWSSCFGYSVCSMTDTSGTTQTATRWRARFISSSGCWAHCY